MGVVEVACPRAEELLDKGEGALRLPKTVTIWSPQVEVEVVDGVLAGEVMPISKERRKLDGVAQRAKVAAAARRPPVAWDLAKAPSTKEVTAIGSAVVAAAVTGVAQDLNISP